MDNSRQHRYSVYILGSLSGTLYVGVTSNLVFRVRQHKDHTFRGFTAKYDVSRLLYYETYSQVATAIRSRETVEGLETGQEDCAHREEQSRVERLEPRLVCKAGENEVPRTVLSASISEVSCLASVCRV